jgi:hypothetical protein
MDKVSNINNVNSSQHDNCIRRYQKRTTGVAQRKRAGLITPRSYDRNVPPVLQDLRRVFTGVAQRKRAGLITPRSYDRNVPPVLFLRDEKKSISQFLPYLFLLFRHCFSFLFQSFHSSSLFAAIAVAASSLLSVQAHARHVKPSARIIRKRAEGLRGT